MDVWSVPPPTTPPRRADEAAAAIEDRRAAAVGVLRRYADHSRTAAVLGGARVPSTAAGGRSKLRETLLRDVSLFRHLCASAPQTAFLRLRVAATEHALVGRLGCAVDAQLPGLLHCLRRFVKALPSPPEEAQLRALPALYAAVDGAAAAAAEPAAAEQQVRAAFSHEALLWCGDGGGGFRKVDDCIHGAPHAARHLGLGDPLDALADDRAQIEPLLLGRLGLRRASADQVVEALAVVAADQVDAPTELFDSNMERTSFIRGAPMELYDANGALRSASTVQLPPRDLEKLGDLIAAAALDLVAELDAALAAAPHPDPPPQKLWLPHARARGPAHPHPLALASADAPLLEAGGGGAPHLSELFSGHPGVLYAHQRILDAPALAPWLREVGALVPLARAVSAAPVATKGLRDAPAELTTVARECVTAVAAPLRERCAHAVDSGGDDAVAKRLRRDRQHLEGLAMLELSLNVQLCEKIEQKYTLRTPPLSVESERDRIRRLQAESRAASAEAVAAAAEARAAAQNPVRAATEAANAQLQARRAAARPATQQQAQTAWTPPVVERTLSLRWSRQGLTIVLSLEGAEEPLGALSEAIHAILRDEEKRAAERWGDADAAAAADADVAAARTRDPDAATVDAWAARLADASSSSRAPGVTPGVPSAAELLDLLAARAPPELVPRPPPAADVVAPSVAPAAGCRAAVGWRSGRGRRPRPPVRGRWAAGRGPGAGAGQHFDS